MTFTPGPPWVPHLTYGALNILLTCLYTVLLKELTSLNCFTQSVQSFSVISKDVLHLLQVLVWDSKKV